MFDSKKISSAIRKSKKKDEHDSLGPPTGPGQVMEENDDYLSQDAHQQEKPEDHSSNEHGNEDQESARREARMARILGKLRRAIQ